MLVRLLRRRSLHDARWSFSQSEGNPHPNTNPQLHPPPKDRSLAVSSHSCKNGESAANNNSNDLHKIQLLQRAFKTLGIPDSNLASIFRKRPKWVSRYNDELLKQKLEFLHSSGFQGPVLGGIICSNPSILDADLNKNLIPFVRFIKGIIPAELAPVAVTALKKCGHPKVSNCLPIIEVLKKHGICKYGILKIFTSHFRVLRVSPRRLDRVVEVVKRVGFHQYSAAFSMAVAVFSILPNKQIKRNLQTFKSLGWKDEELLEAIRKQPKIVLMSDEQILRKMAYLKEVLLWDISVVSRNPSLMGYSIENRFKPRGAVLNLLMFKGLIKKNTGVWRFMYGKNAFHDRFIRRYKGKVPGVEEAYEGRAFEGWEQGCQEKRKQVDHHTELIKDEDILARLII